MSLKNISDADLQLLNAVRADNFKAVQDALDRGADVNVRATHQRTPLYYAATEAGCLVLTLLLQHGAKPDMADEDGLTPLHQAVIAKNFDHAEILLKNGANINFQEDSAPAPLHSAFFRDLRDGETDRVVFLLARNADTAVTMKRGGREMTVIEVVEDTAENFAHARVLLRSINACLETRDQIQEILKRHELKRIAEAAEKGIKKVGQSSRANKNRFKL